MSGYISKFENTWAVIYTDASGNIHIEEYYTEEKAIQALASLK